MGDTAVHEHTLRKPTEWVTKLEESGPGLAPEVAHRLFEAFVTHGKAHRTALGLSLCQRIAAAGSRNYELAVYRVGMMAFWLWWYQR